MASKVTGAEEAGAVGPRKVVPLLRLSGDRPVLSTRQDEEGRQEAAAFGDARPTASKRNSPSRTGVP